MIKKKPLSRTFLWMPGLNCCSCQRGDQSDVWDEEARRIGFESPSVLIVLFRERASGEAGWWHSFCCYSFTSGMYSSKIFMRWVTSTSFVLRLLCRDDICSAQFPHLQQNTALYVGDLIQVSWYFWLAHQKHAWKQMMSLVSTYIYYSIIKNEHAC